MAYYLDLFSPETYETFSKSNREISGFRYRQRNQASKIKPGDMLFCYVTKLSRWIGILEVMSTSFQDKTPIFYTKEDPFIIRFKVKPIVWLDKEHAIPIHDDNIWNTLSFTKNYNKGQLGWTGKVRVSLNTISTEDGIFLENTIREQEKINKIYKLSEQEAKYFISHKVKTVNKDVTVSIPENDENIETSEKSTIRESIKIQSLLTEIGEKMGFKIWLPRNDKMRVIENTKLKNNEVLLEILPLNYDETTLKTIEQIDVIWIKGKSIVRAFEVEHTTSIYSGILRMADLLALQPNMDIKLHIVAPNERKEKVFSEIKRPVFSLLETGPLSEKCTFISYDSVEELAKEKHIEHLSDDVIDEYEEVAE